MSTVGDTLSVAGFRLGWGTVRRLPEPVAYALFARIADVTYARGGRSVQRLRSNYATVRPDSSEAELDALTRAGVRSYLRYWCEAFRLPELSPAQITDRVRCEGDGPVREHLAAGRPVVAFLGHLGNWDFAGAWCTLNLGPVVTVAERLEPEEVFAEFLEFRERLGMRILPLTGAGDVFGELRAALRDPVVLPLLSDRDLTRRGLPVTLCGEPARAAVGPAALAVASGAPLFPVSIWYEQAPDLPGRWRTVIRFHEAVTDPQAGGTRARVEAMTQSCIDGLSEGIRDHLEDWHMMQRVFTRDLSPDGVPG